MSITGVGSSLFSVQSLVDMRRQLDDLQRQLGSGQKADDYAGVGVERGLAVGLRQHLSMLGAYDAAINTVGVRLTLAQTTLGRLADIGHQVQATTFQPTSTDASGSPLATKTAYTDLAETLARLHTQAGATY